VARCCPDLKTIVEQMLDDPAAEKAGPTEYGDEPPASRRSRFEVLRQGAERNFHVSRSFYCKLLMTDNSKRTGALPRGCEPTDQNVTISAVGRGRAPARVAPV
jgi:hypothetical protein